MTGAWRIVVLNRDGTTKATIDLTGAVAGLESFSSDPMWSSGEAVFTALPNAVNVDVRDIIRLLHSDDDFATAMPLYQGVIVSAGSARSSRLQAYRAIGMKQRVYEVTLLSNRIPGGDVGVMGTTVLTEAQTRIPATLLPFAGIPNLGFELGDRFPGLETAGDAMDALVETVGSFTVPAGETYTYAGVTFTAGQVVPATRWGVGATGQYILARPLGPALAFDEGSRRVRVDWRPSDAERVVDRVTLVYASEYSGDPRVLVSGVPVAEPAPVPLAETVQKGGSDKNADRVFVVDGPLDFMTQVVTAAASSYDVTDVADAFDGDPATYALFNADGPGDPTSFFRVDVATSKGVIFVLDYQTSQGQFYSGIAGATMPNINITVRFSGLSVTMQYRSGAEDPARRRMVIPALLPAQALPAAFTEVTFTIAAAEGVRVYELEGYVIDGDAAERLAEAFYRDALEDVAAIEYQGVLDSGLASRAEHVDVTPLGGGAAVRARVERIETSFTVDGGLRTTVYAGQGYDADQEAQRVVLERLARRAVAEGGARR